MSRRYSGFDTCLIHITVIAMKIKEFPAGLLWEMVCLQRERERESSPTLPHTNAACVYISFIDSFPKADVA